MELFSDAFIIILCSAKQTPPGSDGLYLAQRHWYSDKQSRNIKLIFNATLTLIPNIQVDTMSYLLYFNFASLKSTFVHSISTIQALIIIWILKCVHYSLHLQDLGALIVESDFPGDISGK